MRKAMEELNYLKRLSAVKSGKGIKFLSPAISPGCHCPMRMASLTAKEISGLSSLLIGMPECATHVRLFNPKPEGKNGELHWLYVLDQHEVVFGCRKGIMSALRQMDQTGAKAILLIATCIPELIGEDMEGIIQEIQPELSAQVTYVMLGQFKHFSHPPGYWKTLEAMGTLMAARQTNPRCINVLGRSPKETHLPKPALLAQLESKDLTVRYLASGASLTEFQAAPDAALNLVVSPYAQPLATYMEQTFGIPYMALHTRFSVADIDHVYEKLAKLFNIAWDGVFAQERIKALELEKKASQILNGLRFIGSVGISMPLAFAGYLSSLGLEPVLIHMDEFYAEDKEHAKKLLAQGWNPLICRMVNQDAEYPILEKLAVDICFGTLPIRKQAIPNIDHMRSFHGKAGYELATQLLHQILDVAEKIKFSKKGGSEHGTASL